MRRHNYVNIDLTRCCASQVQRIGKVSLCRIIRSCARRRCRNGAERHGHSGCTAKRRDDDLGRSLPWGNGVHRVPEVRASCQLSAASSVEQRQLRVLAVGTHDNGCGVVVVVASANTTNSICLLIRANGPDRATGDVVEGHNSVVVGG